MPTTGAFSRTPLSDPYDRAWPEWVAAIPTARLEGPTAGVTLACEGPEKASTGASANTTSTKSRKSQERLIWASPLLPTCHRSASTSSATTNPPGAARVFRPQSSAGAYGPPDNSAGTGPQIFFLDLQNWIAVHQPVDPLVDFVHRPLYTVTGDPTVTAAVDRHQSASASRSRPGRPLATSHLERPR